MKRIILATIASVAVIAPFWGLAAARTQPANRGTTIDGSQTGQFRYEVNGSVLAMANSQWTSGFVTDTPGLKQVRLAARAAAMGARVQLVAADFLGNVTTVLPFQLIPVSATFQQLNFNLNMVASGTVVITATMNPGARIGTVEYNQ